jgi:hypothetical protein
MIALAAARTNHRTAISNCTQLLTTCLVGAQIGAIVVFEVISYRGTSVLLCGVGFISVVEPQFLLYV